jgi:cytochrome bd-type quinol oxidase subunit 2
MRARIDSILIGILIGALGVWQVLAGLGVIHMNISEWKGPAQVVAGLMFIFGGAWSFFHGTLGPGGQDLPLYPWIQYFMVLPILAGLVFIFLWEGNESGEFMITLLGILTFLGIVWYAVAKFPGRRAKR